MKNTKKRKIIFKQEATKPSRGDGNSLTNLIKAVQVPTPVNDSNKEVPHKVEGLQQQLRQL